jgi:hypothetical protein
MVSKWVKIFWQDNVNFNKQQSILLFSFKVKRHITLTKLIVSVLCSVNILPVWFNVYCVSACPWVFIGLTSREFIYQKYRWLAIIFKESLKKFFPPYSVCLGKKTE